MTIAEATILVVDDEPELLEIFAVWLGRSGCTVVTAPNGAEALRRLDEGPPIDAIISDIRMPIMDGITLVRKIFERERHIPSIIFVSGFGDIDVRDAHALGVEAMLPKPLKRQHLLQALENCLKEREALWLEAPAAAAEQRVEMEFKSLEEATRTRDFSLARGGCCLLSPQKLMEGPVELTIRFAAEGRVLQAQGEVRWYEAKDRHAGVEFTYLAPECRGWVVERIVQDGARSFIPRC